MSWCCSGDRLCGQRPEEIRVRSGLTHEEMGVIGASRETVTRLLSERRRIQLIRLGGSRLAMRNRTAPEAGAT